MLISDYGESKELPVIILGNMPKTWQSSLIQSLTWQAEVSQGPGDQVPVGSRLVVED